MVCCMLQLSQFILVGIFNNFDYGIYFIIGSYLMFEYLCSVELFEQFDKMLFIVVYCDGDLFMVMILFDIFRLLCDGVFIFFFIVLIDEGDFIDDRCIDLLFLDGRFWMFVVGKKL